MITTFRLLIRRLAAWAVFPTLLLHQVIKFQSAVTRMFSPIQGDRLFARFAPPVSAIGERAGEYLRAPKVSFVNKRPSVTFDTVENYRKFRHF
jgi:hypothetical protein